MVGTLKWLSTPVLAKRRNDRYAARVRGALASLRETGRHAAGHLPHRSAMLEALNARPEPEKFHQH